MGDIFATYDNNDPNRLITGFYDSDIAQMPAGIAFVQLSAEEYDYLLQTPAGKRQALNENRKPVRLDAPPPSPAQTARPYASVA